MSNQIGLILSFLFLSIFLGVCSDIFAYQSFETTFNTQTLNIVNYIQKNGYTQSEIKSFVEQYDIDEFNIERTLQDYCYHYKILFVKNYDSKLFIDGAFDRKITKKYEIFQKR